MIRKRARPVGTTAGPGAGTGAEAEDDRALAKSRALASGAGSERAREEEEEEDDDATAKRLREARADLERRRASASASAAAAGASAPASADAESDAIVSGDAALVASRDEGRDPSERERRARLATVDVDPADLKKPSSRFGPASAPVYVRATTITDYKPDVCKDFKETGYCGFGDSCIYAHIRGSAKVPDAARLDVPWSEKQRKAQAQAQAPASATESKMIGCPICRAPFEAQPLVRTTCGHYFCKSCAFARYRSSPTCAACGTQTKGVFNDAERP